MNMLYIIKKNLLRYLLAPVPAFTFLAVYAFGSGVNNPANFTWLMGIVIFIVTLAPAVVIEMEEERNKGYAFLATLPFPIGEVVRIKFLMLLVSIVALGLAGFAILAGMGLPAPLLSETVKILLLSLTLCIVIESLVLTLTYRYGAIPAVTSLMVVTLLMNVGTFISFRDGLPGKAAIAGVGGAVKDLGWFYQALFAAAGLAAFFLMMRLAVRIKGSRMI